MEFRVPRHQVERLFARAAFSLVNHRRLL